MSFAEERHASDELGVAFWCLFIVYFTATKYLPLQKNAQVGKQDVDEKSKNDDTVKDEKEIANITPETKPYMFERCEEKSRHMETNNQGTNGVNKELLQACYCSLHV